MLPAGEIEPPSSADESMFRVNAEKICVAQLHPDQRNCPPFFPSVKTTADLSVVSSAAVPLNRVLLSVAFSNVSKVTYELLS